MEVFIPFLSIIGIVIAIASAVKKENDKTRERMEQARKEYSQRMAKQQNQTTEQKQPRAEYKTIIPSLRTSDGEGSSADQSIMEGKSSLEGTGRTLEAERAGAKAITGEGMSYNESFADKAARAAAVDASQVQLEQAPLLPVYANSYVNAIVMSEIMAKPRSRRRAIR